jgi:phosphoribosylaminoimidazole-succinocarboxamide synthase
MLCRQLQILPVEFIWREKAWGSFCKMYGVKQGYPLNGLIEATLKDDALGDPRINREACVLLRKLTPEQYDQCDTHVRNIGVILKRALEKYDYALIDFKVEFGINAAGELMMGDEISGGIWRLLDKDGKSVDPLECAKRICG